MEGVNSAEKVRMAEFEFKFRTKPKRHDKGKQSERRTT
jgi:hypothetical protein